MKSRSTTILTAVVWAVSLAFAGASGAQQPSAEARQCLDAVASGDHRSAVVLCQRALDADPENAQLKAALDQAKAAVQGTNPMEGN